MLFTVPVTFNVKKEPKEPEELRKSKESWSYGGNVGLGHKKYMKINRK